MKKKKKDVVNFCDVCGLKIRIVESSEIDASAIEDFLKKIAELGLRRKMRYSRNVFDILGEQGFSEFCSLGNKKWIKKGSIVKISS